MWGSQAFNQWALQPAMFNDVPHEQIDWAALAKQWIQMQHNEPGEGGSSPKPPLPMPISEKFPREGLNQPLLKTPPQEHYHGLTVDPERTFPAEQDNFIPKMTDDPYWKNNWDSRPVNDMDDRLWAPPPPPPPVAPPLPSMLPGKTTFDYGHMHDNPPLAMQTVDYNHVSDYSYNPVPMYVPPESHYDQYWSQVNVAPPTISPIFLKKDRHSSHLRVEEDTSHIDAAKRKQLPAWIREGLEKMEQERLKRLEKEKADKEKAEKLSKTSSARKMSSLLKTDDSSIAMPSKSKFESDSEIEDETDSLPSKENQQRRDTSSPVEDSRTDEEKKQDLMLKVRRMLTEILLSVTNAEIVSIAQEVYRKAVSRAPARQLASSTSLTPVASGLCGLASYGSESEASSGEEEKETSDSDDDLYQRIKEKRRQFAIKEKKILAELERQELEEKEEEERIKNEILARNSKKEEQENDSGPVQNLSETIPTEDNSSTNCEKIPVQDDDKPKSVKGDTEMAKSPPNEKSSSKDAEKASDSDDSGSSSSSSSSSNDDSSTNHKTGKSRKKEYESKNDRRKSSSSRKDDRKRRRSRSRDSDISDRHTESSHSSRGKHKSSSKKKKRSDSSSSSSSNARRTSSSKSHNHRSRGRSYSRERSRKRDRSRSSSSTRHHRRNSRSSKSSYSRHSERDRYEKRSKDDKRHKYSQSPPRHSSRLPQKYRTSRSPSSENGSSGKKSKTKSRNR